MNDPRKFKAGQPPNDVVKIDIFREGKGITYGCKRYGGIIVKDHIVLSITEFPIKAWRHSTQ